jgi:hypothetical protein
MESSELFGTIENGGLFDNMSVIYDIIKGPPVGTKRVSLSSVTVDLPRDKSTLQPPHHGHIITWEPFLL